MSDQKKKDLLSRRKSIVEIGLKINLGSRSRA